eukprot:TRINITY_DN4868_c0_g1_i2.p2 TRINITY_DN4868_c0_g1~~TRINITY_DN4868_c0_g1_i2.p2  ORF type:complete len:204 (+),score=7.84 TRINITY_DN4868_c0_g1_i2:315-926(+)
MCAHDGRDRGARRRRHWWSGGYAGFQWPSYTAEKRGSGLDTRAGRLARLLKARKAIGQVLQARKAIGGVHCECECRGAAAAGARGLEGVPHFHVPALLVSKAGATSFDECVESGNFRVKASTGLPRPHIIQRPEANYAAMLRDETRVCGLGEQGAATPVECALRTGCLCAPERQQILSVESPFRFLFDNTARDSWQRSSTCAW